jgi:hypothetical protein
LVGPTRVRPALFVAAAVAIAAIVPVDALRSVLATAASALLEATPFLLAGRLLANAAGARSETAAYLGCGCGAGPAARSLPAAAATWLLFGPALACARLAAAIGIARLLRERADEGTVCAHRGGFLEDLSAMVAPALACGVAMQLLPLLDLARANSVAAAVAGAALGFASAPCALGSVALAGAMHARAPLAAASFLCVAGLIDARTVLRRGTTAHGEDALGYLVAVLALGIVALRGGAALVHPYAAWFLGASAIAGAVLFVHHRRERNGAVRLAPALMLAGALVTAPPPVYRATETTLAGAFPGERVTFLGVLARDRSHDALVRYAILCCRADATPVVLRLATRAHFAAGAWLRAEGTMIANGSELLFAPAVLERTAPPLDPFVYR